MLILFIQQRGPMPVVYNSHLYTLQSTSLTLLDDQRLKGGFVSIIFHIT